jgi:hypothetical protein
MITHLLGLVAVLCFGFAGVPPAVSALRSGTTLVPRSTAWLIVIGCLTMYWYLYASYGFDAFLAVNYSVEVASWAVILWYAHRPRVWSLDMTPTGMSAGVIVRQPGGVAIGGNVTNSVINTRKT